MGTRKNNKNQKKLGRKTRSRKQKGSGTICSRPGQCTTNQNNMEEEDPNSIDDYLQVAIEEEDALNVKKYLDEGANPNNVMITDEHENIQGSEIVPAVIYAARHIQPSTILKHLVNHGANIESDELHNGLTPLIEAAEWGNLSAVKFLLNNGANINATAGSGVTAIGFAVLNEDIPMINLMLEKRKGEIDFNYTVFGIDNENVIDEANEYGRNPEVAKILKEYAIEQKLPEIRKRQKDRTRADWLFRGKNTENNMNYNNFPEEMKHSIKSFLGGKKKIQKNKKQLGGDEKERINNAFLGAVEVAPADERDYEAVKKLVEQGADVNMRASEEWNNGKTPLILITENADEDDEDDEYLLPTINIVKLLIKNGADISAKDNNGWTALELTGSGSIQKLLILELMRQNNKYYDDPNILISQQFSPGSLTVKTNDSQRTKEYKIKLKERLVKYLKEARETIKDEKERKSNIKNLEDVHTEVISNIKERNEVKKENPNIVEQEIEQCANQCRETIKAKYDQKPYEKVLGNPDLKREIAKNFGGKKERKTRKNHRKKKHGIKTRSKRQRGGGKEENDELIRAGFEGNLEKVQELLNNDADVNAKNKLGNTALINASMTGHTETVALLLEKGADVNANNNNGHTALILAIWNRYTETVALLLEKGADVNVKGNDGETALLVASGDGHKEIVAMLLEKGADVNAKNNDGFTSLMWASNYEHTEIVRLLLENGADVNAKSNDGQTALMIVSDCDEEFMEYFIGLQGDRQVQMMNNKENIISLLQRYGADFSLKDNNNNTAFDLANQCSDSWVIADDIIKLLKRYIVVQHLQTHKKIQKDQTKLGWMLRGIKVKNRDMRFPYDLEHYIRGFIG